MTCVRCVVRHAVPSDHAAVQRLHHELLCVKYGPRFFEAVFGDRRYTTLVAEVDDRVIGFCVFFRVWTVLAGRNAVIADLYTLGVAEGQQHQGVGGELIERGCEEMEALGCDLVRLHCLARNGPVRRFYARHGFIEVEIVPRYYTFGPAPEDGVLLHRPLSPEPVSCLSYWWGAVRAAFVDALCD